MGKTQVEQAMLNTRFISLIGGLEFGIGTEHGNMEMSNMKSQVMQLEGSLL